MMKNLTNIFILMALFTSQSMAQSSSYTITSAPKKWKVSQANFGVGINWDHYQSMSLDRLLVLAEDPEIMYRNVQNMTEETVTFTAGGAVYGSLSFSPLNRANGTYKDDQELQIGVAMHSAKEAMVSFKNEDLDTSIVYCNIHSEMTLEGAYVFKGQWGKRFHWYAGAGLNAAFTMDNEMLLVSGKYFAPGEHPSTQESLEINRERYKAKPVYYSRLYIPYGIHYRIGENLLLGFDFRRGIGMQTVHGESARFIKKSGALILGLKYRME